jgi:urate oxidase
MSFKLDFNTHGKGRVRLVKVVRGRDGRHDVIQLNVQILLEGYDMEDVFTAGNNKKVVATDTCKNTVYCIANETNFTSIEDFGIALANHFIAEYPDIVNKVHLHIKKDQWERLTVPDSAGRNAPHQHCFKRIGPQMPFTDVVAHGNRGKVTKLEIKSGFRALEIMKTTQSGFVDFHRNRFTSLPEVEDRLVGTSADAEWVYSSDMVRRGGMNFNQIYADIEAALIRSFTGPADKGVYSASVQQTLYQMATAALLATGSIDEITLMMPNIHNIPFNLEQYGLKNKDHTGNPSIFFPIDEPHGMIKATVKRNSRSKL